MEIRGRSEDAETASLSGTSTPELGEQIWKDSDHIEYEWWCKRERDGTRGREIIEYINSQMPIAGSSAVEVGSGKGVYSRLLAERGANVTLLDYSPAALEGPRHMIAAAGLQGRCRFLSPDALFLPAGLLGHFDVAMSFGSSISFIRSGWQWPGRTPIWYGLEES